MTRTLVQNPYQSPYTLPYPFSHVLMPGAGVVVPLSVDQIIASLSGKPSGLLLSEAPSAETGFDILAPGGQVTPALFGAVGDGITDDSAAVQQCAEDCATGGFRMYIPPGSYLLKNGIDLPSNLTVIGCAGAELVADLETTGLNATSCLLIGTAPNGNAGTLQSAAAAGAETISSSISVSAGGEILIRTTSGPTQGTALCRTVIDVSGAGPYTLTLDEPLSRAFADGSSVTILTSVPKDVRVFGNGMVLRGTCERFIEMLCAQDCVFSDIYIHQEGAPNGPFTSFDLSCRRCHFIRCRTRGGSSLNMESSENCTMQQCHAQGIDAPLNGSGLALIGGVNCAIIDSTSEGFGTGSAIVVTPYESAPAIGCEIRSSAGRKSSNGCYLNGGSSCRIVGGVYEDNTGVGVLIGNGAVGCAAVGAVRAQRNNIGISVTDLSEGSVVSDADVSYNTQHGLLAFGPVSVHGIYAEGAYTQAALQFTTLANQPTLRQSVSGYRVILAAGTANSAGGIVSTGSHVRATNGHVSLREADTIGVRLIASGSTPAVIDVDGLDIDASGAGNHYARNGAAPNTGRWRGLVTVLPDLGYTGYNNRGTLVSNGATPVDVTWPDLSDFDNVTFTLRTPGGTPGAFSYTKTPGTKFTFTGTALDTGTYEYIVH